MSEMVERVARAIQTADGDYSGPNSKPEFYGYLARAAIEATFHTVDDQDWEYLFSLIPDGGRGRFWKAVFTEIDAALSEKTTPSARATTR